MADLVCNVCDRHIGAPQFHYERRLGICGGCARLAAAAYHLSHGGEIPLELRKPDDEAFFGCAARPLARGYQKASIHSKLRWEVFRRDGYRCLACDSLDDLTADHITPEVTGGKTVLENLQTLCRPCNSRKCANMVEENA